jgi:hypothetical protein
MTSKSVHRAIPLGFREKSNLRPVIGLRPDVDLHSAINNNGLSKVREQTASTLFCQSLT